MKKILFIMNNLAGGGAEKLLIELLETLDKDKFKLTLILLDNEGIYLKRLKRIKKLQKYYVFEELNKENSFFKRKLKKVFKFIICLFPNLFFKKIKKKDEYDIGVAYLEGPTTLFLSNLKNCKKKIAWVHIDLERHKTMNRTLEKKAYSKMNKIICVSNDSKKSVENLYPELKEKTEVIYNPIPKEEILKSCLKEINIYSTEKLNIIAVGRLNKQKGYDLLLKTHNELLKEGLDYNLYILGEGEERKKLEQYITDNNIEKNTFLLGFKENPYPYIKEADIFVSSSRYEGYSLVVAEALCLEKPIIATKCVGPMELLDNGKYGLLAEGESVESLKENMKKLILSEKLRKKYSDLARERANIFDVDKTMKQIERVLNE